MIKVDDFNKLIDRAMLSSGRAHMRPVIAKELLHYDILFALDNESLLDQLTFQGGTALRLCYGAARFSEDLDFVSTAEFTTLNSRMIKACLEQYIGTRYGLEITVKEPKDLLNDPTSREVNVNKWQVNIITEPKRKDLPKQRIKLEIASLPAYTRTPLPLQQNYDFLPDGYDDIVIMTETLDEILADKVVAFVNCQKYIRYRDIWDIRWLKQRGATLNLNYVSKKIQDYGIEDYKQKLNKTLDSLENTIQSREFMAEMQRFIPMDIQERTLQKPKFLTMLFNENSSLLQEISTIFT